MAEFAAPGATFDLLLTLHWISPQPSCDRATALMILTHAAETGLQTKDCPDQMEPQAAKAFCAGLHNTLVAGRLLPETFMLQDADIDATDAQLGPDGPFPRTEPQRRTTAARAHYPACTFARQRPVMRPLAA